MVEHMLFEVTETRCRLVDGPRLTCAVNEISAGISTGVLHALITQVTYCVVLCKKGVYFLVEQMLFAWTERTCRRSERHKQQYSHMGFY